MLAVYALRVIAGIKCCDTRKQGVVVLHTNLLPPGSTDKVFLQIATRECLRRISAAAAYRRNVMTHQEIPENKGGGQGKRGSHECVVQKYCFPCSFCI